MLHSRAIKSKNKTTGLQVLETFFGGKVYDLFVLAGVGFENEVRDVSGDELGD